jgi:hypothetical protein
MRVDVWIEMLVFNRGKCTLPLALSAPQFAASQKCGVTE